jgi:hypothetical protein
MAETIFYVKQGRRYVPHSTYEPKFCDAFPKGTHLVQSYPGGTLRRYNIDPAYAPMIAAGRIAEDVISRKVMEASEIRRSAKHRNTPLTPSQKAAWDNLVAEFGDDAKQLEWPSARECAEEAVKAMQIEANKLMQNESVRKAYDHFQLMCKLVAENDNEQKS